MEQLDPAPLKRARTINNDPGFYGTFAEIGAGQEVARYFFVAGKASQTIAKSISAYDMTFSDSIYGKTGRYVCEERLNRMLDHEYSLLVERLNIQRGDRTRFFVLADTVATSTQEEPGIKCHGWMGIRFQAGPKGPVNNIVLHVRMKDKSRLQQQEALGILGVNLVDLGFRPPLKREELLERIMENLHPDRLEINLIKVSGPSLSSIENRLLNLEMVRRGISEAALFEPSGQITNPSDVLFKKPIMVQRGTFRPVTNVNLKLLEKGFEQFQKQHGSLKPEILFELTMNSLVGEGVAQEKDFLDRVDTLCALGHRVLLSNFDLFFQVKGFLRSYTDQPIAMIVGARHLEKLFDPKYYQNLKGGILEGFSRLFDETTEMLVFPYKSGKICETTATFHPTGGLDHLFKYLVGSQKIVDISGCDDVDTSLHSEDVRRMLSQGDRDWEKMVPPAVKNLIQSRKLFGPTT